jgi:hypothetical protein
MASSVDFAPSQEWQYKTRSADINSSLVIGGLETHEKMGDIVHIAIKNVRVANPDADGGFSTHISHIPISPPALRASVINMVNSDTEADGITEGIAAWREANGGVFTISVAEVVQYIEELLSGGEAVRK